MGRLQSLLGFVLLFSANLAWAQIAYQSFTDRADNTVELIVRGSRGPTTFKGVVKPGDTLQSRSGSLNADITRYAEHPFVAVAVTEDGKEVGYVFILERQNGGYVLINDKPISGKAASLSIDLQDAVRGLRKVKGNDISLVLRTLANYFAMEPNADLYSLADGLENRQQKVLEQVSRVATPGQAPRGEKIPPRAEDSTPIPPQRNQMNPIDAEGGAAQQSPEKSQAEDRNGNEGEAQQDAPPVESRSKRSRRNRQQPVEDYQEYPQYPQYPPQYTQPYPQYPQDGYPQNYPNFPGNGGNYGGDYGGQVQPQQPMPAPPQQEHRRRRQAPPQQQPQMPGLPDLGDDFLTW